MYKVYICSMHIIDEMCGVCIVYGVCVRRIYVMYICSMCVVFVV